MAAILNGRRWGSTRYAQWRRSNVPARLGQGGPTAIDHVRIELLCVPVPQTAEL
jgi:hypothetical protein